MWAYSDDSVFSIISSQHVLKSPASIPGWCLAAAGTPDGCRDCEIRRQSGNSSAAPAAGVFRRFPSRLPKEVPHDKPETLLQPRGPCGGAQQYFCHQDVSQPLHAGNAHNLSAVRSKHQRMFGVSFSRFRKPNEGYYYAWSSNCSSVCCVATISSCMPWQCTTKINGRLIWKCSTALNLHVDSSPTFGLHWW